MASKRRCSLCGERLDSSLRCTACGLDNTKNDDMYKHLINQNDCQDEPLTHVHEEPKVNKNYGKVTYTYNKNVNTVRKAAKSSKKKGGVVGIVVMIIMLFSTIIPSIFMIVENLGIGIYEEIVTPEYEFTLEDDFVYEDEFNYEYWLGEGFYEIGVHLPEGEYTISMDNGDYASVDLYEFDGEYWGNTDFWYFDVYNGETIHELWLETGDLIVINAKEDLRFATWWDESHDTENEILMEGYESYYVSGTVVAGQDVPAGVYDIYYVPNSEWECGYVSLKLKDFAEYEGELPIYFDAEIGEGYFANLPLTPGSVIEIDEGIEGISLIPSYVIGQQMYDMTWGAE